MCEISLGMSWYLRHPVTGFTLTPRRKYEEIIVSGIAGICRVDVRRGPDQRIKFRQQRPERFVYRSTGRLLKPTEWFKHSQYGPAGGLQQPIRQPGNKRDRRKQRFPQQQRQ